MPHPSVSHLPDRVKEHLPRHAQAIYREVSHQVIRSAVEQKYKKPMGRGAEKRVDVRCG